MTAENLSVIASPTTSTSGPRVAPARADERWRESGGGQRPAAVAIAVVAFSLVIHAALLTIALLGSRAEAAAQQEIPIEVVQEAPPAEALKPAPPPPQAAKPPTPVAPPAPAPVATKPPPPPPPSAAETQRAELERQLDALKAEQQALKSETADLGPLRDSIRAAALPSDGDDGELVGYQTLVFSQLAKAKDGARETAKPGTVGVRFSVDDTGGLVDVAVAVSSGVAALDAESLAIVRRAAPFPRPPAGAERTFSANFSYAVAQR